MSTELQRAASPMQKLKAAALHNQLRIERLVPKNMAMVHWAVRRVLHIYDGHPDYDEAVSEGVLALTRAAIGFNHVWGTTFSTYATRCIIRELLKWSKKEWRYGFGGATGRPVRPDELKEAWDTKAETVIEDKEGALDTSDKVKELEEAMRFLPPRMQEVIRLRHINGMTLEAIAEVTRRDQGDRSVGICKERVRQLVARGIEALKMRMNPPVLQKGPVPLIQRTRRCRNCGVVIPNEGNYKYCRRGTGCRKVGVRPHAEV